MKSLTQNKLLFRVVFWTWLVIIIVSSLIPNISTKGMEDKLNTELRFDYLIHFFIYFILAYAFIMQFPDINRFRNKIFFWIILSGVAFGVGLECLQIIIPGRAFNVLDIVFNTAGIVFGLFVSYLILFKTSKK